MVVVLGCGYTGTAVARLARSRGEEVVAMVRSAASEEKLRAQGFAVAREVPPEGYVVVCYPPDGSEIERAASLAGRAITYVSSTGVYADGAVDDTTPVVDSPRTRKQLDAEAAWRSAGATILRSPAIYGPDRGLHRRVVRGEHRIPGDGSNYTSRIHVEDLAALLLAARDVRGETFVVGDDEPATQASVCAWVCERYGVPHPPSVPPEEVHVTLRSDRRVDGRRALERLGVKLRYPTFREGMDVG